MHARVGDEAPGDPIRLPIRPFSPSNPSRPNAWAFKHPGDGTFAFVSPYESSYESPGQPRAETTHHAISCLTVDGQVQYGDLPYNPAYNLHTNIGMYICTCIHR